MDDLTVYLHETCLFTLLLYYKLTVQRMSSVPLSDMYLTCTLLTTFAFIYLIYDCAFSARKTPHKISLHFEEIDHFASNIEAVFDSEPNQFTPSTTQSIRSQETVSTSSGPQNKTVCTKKCVTEATDRQKPPNISVPSYKFLPYADLGLQEMKVMNKRFLRETAYTIKKSKSKVYRKKMAVSYVKKYDFHRTALPTVYEEVEY